MERELDPELLAYFHATKDQITEDHKKYLLSHPEIRQILQDFLSKLLLKKPENIYDFANEYFSYFKSDIVEDGIKPLVICAPSGCGKGTVINRLLKEFPQAFKLSVSFTTRQPRKGEVDGVNYFYVSREDFEAEIAKNNFIEYVKYADNYYGTNKTQVQSICNEGKICLLEIEIKGAQKVFRSGLDCNYLFIMPPSIEALRERLINRGTEELEIIEKRVSIAKGELEELQGLSFFKKRLVNDDFETFYQETLEYLHEVYPSFGFKSN